MRRRGAHCRCRPRPRYRVRRPILGLVHGNYPPGLAATYHFIPKQTTLILYRLRGKIAIRFSPFLRKFFCFFRSRRCCNPRRGAVLGPWHQDTIPGVSIFFPFSSVFRPQIQILESFRSVIQHLQGFAVQFLHTPSRVSSQHLPAGGFSPGGRQGFFAFFRGKLLAWFAAGVLSLFWMRNRCKFFPLWQRFATQNRFS